MNTNHPTNHSTLELHSVAARCTQPTSNVTKCNNNNAQCSVYTVIVIIALLTTLLTGIIYSVAAEPFAILAGCFFRLLTTEKKQPS